MKTHLKQLNIDDEFSHAFFKTPNDMDIFCFVQWLMICSASTIGTIVAMIFANDFYENVLMYLWINFRLIVFLPH